MNWSLKELAAAATRYRQQGRATVRKADTRMGVRHVKRIEAAQHRTLWLAQNAELRALLAAGLEDEA